MPIKHRDSTIEIAAALVYIPNEKGEIISHVNPLRPKRIKLNGSPYLKFNAYVQGKMHGIKAHRLVWTYFRGPIPDNMTVNHIDLDKLNNAIGNLELLSHRENIQHAARNGVMCVSKNRGEANQKSKINEHQVREARELRDLGFEVRYLCRKYGLKDTAMRYLLSGKHWSHVK